MPSVETSLLHSTYELGLAPMHRKLLENILELHAAGTTLAKACKEYGVKPAAVLEAVAKFPLIEARFRAARLGHAEELVGSIEDMAEQAATAEKEAVSGLKVSIDTKMWLAEKFNPESYGRKTESTVTKINVDANLSTREKIERFRQLAKGADAAVNVTPAPTEEGNVDYDPNE